MILGFIPEAVHRLAVAAEPAQVRRLLQLLDLVNEENKALDPNKYANALVNVTRSWHKKMNVSLSEVLAFPNLQPWDSIDLTNRQHRMLLVMVVSGLGLAVEGLGESGTGL